MRKLIVIASLLGACTAPLLAQWPRYRVPTVPRTSAGAPNLDAPAPRTADGKPDLSGIWENFRKPGDSPVRSVNAQFFDDRPPSLINEFRDIGENVKGGLPLQPWAAALKQQRTALLEPAPQPVERHVADRHEALAVAFADDPDEAAVERQVLEVETCPLADAEP